MTTEATTRPWWANLLTSALTTLIGAVLIVVAVCVLRPELAPNGDVYWGGLFALGLAFVMTGGSMLGVNAARGSASPPPPLTRSGPPRGMVTVQALGAVAGVAFALVLLLFAALSVHGCGGSQYAAQRKATVDWWPGPPCHLEVRLDDDPKPVVTVDAPTACEPPPSTCKETP